MPSTSLKPSWPARETPPPSPPQSNWRNHLKLDLTSVMQDGYRTSLLGKSHMDSQSRQKNYSSTPHLKRHHIWSFLGIPLFILDMSVMEVGRSYPGFGTMACCRNMKHTTCTASLMTSMVRKNYEELKSYHIAWEYLERIYSYSYIISILYRHQSFISSSVTPIACNGNLWIRLVK